MPEAIRWLRAEREALITAVGQIAREMQALIQFWHDWPPSDCSDGLQEGSQHIQPLVERLAALTQK